MNRTRTIYGALELLVGLDLLWASACGGRIDAEDLLHDGLDHLARGGSGPTTVTPGSGGQTVTSTTGLNCSETSCATLQNDYSAALAEVTSCVKGANYTQCIGTRVVGLVCPCKKVVNERHVDALARLTEIEKAWAQARCLDCLPNVACGICVEQTISSAYGGCSPTTGLCEYHEW